MKSILFSLLIAFGVFASAQTSYKVPITQALTTANTQVLQVNANRNYLLIQNTGSNPIVVSFDNVNPGFTIASGGSWEPGHAPINSVYLKSSTSTSTAVVVEGQ
jgi:hypothetical protein